MGRGAWLDHQRKFRNRVRRLYLMITGLLLKEDGGAILKEDGGKIIWEKSY